MKTSFLAMPEEGKKENSDENEKHDKIRPVKELLEEYE